MLHRIACRSHTDRRRSLVELAASLSIDRHAMSRANLPHRAQDDRLHLQTQRIGICFKVLIDFASGAPKTGA
jgi:hypothetical protein